jgi:hypothetical protein
VREKRPEKQDANWQDYEETVQKHLLCAPEDEHERNQANDQLSKVIRVVDLSQPPQPEYPLPGIALLR